VLIKRPSNNRKFIK